MKKAQEASFPHLLFAQECVTESFVIYFIATLTLSFSVNSNSVAEGEQVSGLNKHQNINGKMVKMSKAQRW